MSETIAPRPLEIESRPQTLGFTSNFARNLVFQRLAALPEGSVTVVDGSETRRFGQTGDLHATITVHDPAMYVDIAFGGSLGAAEAYIQGRWSCDDLTALCRIFARNLDHADSLERGWARLAAPFAKAFHWLRRNTRRGSGKNISAHYDLGNDFFQLFLDETMSYSSAIFPEPDTLLAEASFVKMERICQKLELQPDDHLLEIGTGWGSLAIHAAAWHGCRVTTVTISRRQYELAAERIAQAGLSDRITLLLRDYRDIQGRFDKIVSVEMIEAVGHEFLDDYFRTCSGLLQPDGMMLLQAITIGDHRYERYRKSVDFIQRYVFPGSCLPSVAAICASVSRAADLRPAHLEDLTPHYAQTLRLWRRRFFERIDEVKRMGYSDNFIRLWEYYLRYCEAGFEEGVCGDVQLLLTKPRRRRDTVLLDGLRDGLTTPRREAACLS